MGTGFCRRSCWLIDGYIRPCCRADVIQKRGGNVAYTNPKPPPRFPFFILTPPFTRTLDPYGTPTVPSNKISQNKIIIIIIEMIIDTAKSFGQVSIKRKSHSWSHIYHMTFTFWISVENPFNNYFIELVSSYNVTLNQINHH